MAAAEMKVVEGKRPSLKYEPENTLSIFSRDNESRLWPSQLLSFVDFIAFALKDQL